MGANTLLTSIVTGGTNSHTTTAEEANALSTDFVTQGVVGAITLNTGSGGTGSFCVNADGSPDMGVTIKAGQAYVTATPSSQNSQVLRVRASADYTTYVINANSSGSTKFDWIYLSINATNANSPAADGSNVASLVTSRSSSNTVDNGTPPTYGLLLAIVTVANGASSITNSNITDKRFNTSIGAQNGSLIVTQSSTGNDAVIQAAGVDSSVSLDIKPKGSSGVAKIYDGAGNVQFDGSGPIRMTELARLTLGATGTTLTTPAFAAKKYLRILFVGVATGGTVRPNIRFNGDTANNYTWRNSQNTAAESTGTAQSAILTESNAAQNCILQANIINIAAAEKLVNFKVALDGGSGTSVAPNQSYGSGKWVNTSSQITSVTIFSDGTGNFSNAGSELIVLGSN